MVSLTTRVIRNARSKGVTVYTRKQWGSANPAKYAWRSKYRSHSLLPNKPVDTVWQHITVTRDSGRSSKQFKADMRTLERIGNDRFDSGVSYNWVIDAWTGEVGLGQNLDAAGTHTINDKNIPGYSKNQNYVSIAISVLGMPGVQLSQKAGDALVNLIKAHIEEGAVTVTFDYNGHRYVAYKDCPTDNIIKVMPAIRKAALAKPQAKENAEPVALKEEVTVERKMPNRDAALPPLRKMRNAAKKGSPRRRKLNRFLRWLRSL